MKSDTPLKSIKINQVESGYNGYFKLDILEYRHTLYRGGWSDTVKRELFARGPAVVVLLYDLSREVVVLVEQCRAGALTHATQNGQSEQAWLLEPVAGMIDLCETPQQAGIREAKEEAGVELSALEYICEYYPSPGACDETLHLYATEIDATLLPEYAGLDSENEDIKIVQIPFEQARLKLASGEFNVSSTIITLQWFFYQKLTQIKA